MNLREDFDHVVLLHKVFANSAGCQAKNYHCKNDEGEMVQAGGEMHRGLQPVVTVCPGV